MKKLTLLSVILVSVAAVAQPVPPVPPTPPMPPLPGFFHASPGIPPAVAAKLGISPELVKKIQQLGFDSNDAMINLEADLKRAQLDLDRSLAQPSPDESATLAKLDRISRAELQVRKNRMSLMLKIRALLGPELWQKVEAELPMMADPGGGRREVRILRKREGNGPIEEDVQVH